MSFPRIPIVIETVLAQYLRDFQMSLTSMLKDYVRKDSPVESVLLASPNGAVYTVAVDDTGTLVVTKIKE